MKEAFARFVRSLAAYGYALRPLDEAATGLRPRCAYLRYDVLPRDLEAALRLAELHAQLRLPATFHIAWDVLEGAQRVRAAARRFRAFDRQFVRLGLQCDPVSRWLALASFGGDDAALNQFVRSAAFHCYLADMLDAFRADGADAPALQAIGAGAWDCLVGVHASFSRAFDGGSTISGRGSPLSNAFLAARRNEPELADLAQWFSPIDFLAGSGADRLGYGFEATRFAADEWPGPAVVFGGVELSELAQELRSRVAGGGGIVAIFPAQYWEGGRYADLLPPPGEFDLTGPAPDRADDRQRQFAERPTAAPAGAKAKGIGPAVDAIPEFPVITREPDLAAFGRRGDRYDKAELIAAARRRVGGGIDASFPRFVAWLRSEGYVFDGFEDGPPRFDQRRAYLRHDVHIQDLLPAYVLAELHEQLGIVGSFQITWKFSRFEEALEPFFMRLLEFDRRFVRFGLHAAPTATWFLRDRLGGDASKQAAAVSSHAFSEWLLDLHAAYERDGEDAPGLREIRSGTDDALSAIGASFRATFGEWKGISGHGNFLTNAFERVHRRHPQISPLLPYFHPVEYLLRWGVARFGFDFEITSFGSDAIPYPRVLMEGGPEAVRREGYRGRVAHGGGFVALLHPATWTSRRNATFFLSDEECPAVEAGAGQ